MLIAGLLVVAGAITGVLAGLFGVGGGVISVPILYFCFGLIGLSDDLAMPMAVGTSLAIIIPTSIRSALGHYKKGAVDVAIVKAWAIPVLLSVMLGSWLARFADAWVFQSVFVVVALTNAAKHLGGNTSWRIANDLPKGALALGLRCHCRTVISIDGHWWRGHFKSAAHPA